MKKIKFIALILTLSIVIGLFAACSGNGSIGAKTIDAKDYITVNYGKYDGHSDPYFDVDRISMSSVFDNEKFAEFKETLPESVQFELNYTTSYAHFFDFDFAEDYNNVSNGDKLVINIALDSYLTDYGVTMDDFCKACGIKFKETTLEYTVSGLETLSNVLDPLENMEQYIKINGANGYGSLDLLNSIVVPDDYIRQIGNMYFTKNGKNSVKIVVDNIKVATISYSVSGEDNLTAGDTVKLKATVTPYGESTEDNGIVFVGDYVFFKESVKDVVVPDLGYYILSAEEMTSDIVSEVIRQIIDEHGANTVEKIFFTSYQPGVERKRTLPCFFTVVTIDKRNLSFYEHYYIDTVESILVKPDGTIEIEFEEESYPYYSSTENAVGAFDYDYYVYTELTLY